MSLYNKLVPDIIQSSIWNEPSDIRIVWLTLLALKDMNGYVRGDARTIARMANVSVEMSEEALKRFQEPDPMSRTPDHEGRRIAPFQGGWIVLNHGKYTEIGMSEAVKAYWRSKKQAERSEKLLGNVSDTSRSVPVSSTSTSTSPSGISSREGGVGETEPRYSLEQCIRAGATVGVTEEMATAFFTHYAGVNFVDGAGRAIARLPYALAKWKQQQQQRDADYDAKNPYAKFAGTECGRDVSKEPEEQEGDEG